MIRPQFEGRIVSGSRKYQIAGSLAMILIRNEIFHKVFTVISVLLFLVYVAALFDYLKMRGL